MRLIRLPDEENNLNDWVVQNGAAYSSPAGVVLTDGTSPLNVLYVMDLRDETAFDPMLSELIAAELAVVLCMPLTQSADKLNIARGERERLRAIAQLVNSQENSPREWSTDVVLRARR